jgi:Flp pilus assembly pilin Flp
LEYATPRKGDRARTAARRNRRDKVFPFEPFGEVSPINEFLADVRDEAGQTMAEYAVVLGVITIAVVVTLGLLSTAIKNTLNNVISSL